MAKSNSDSLAKEKTIEYLEKKGYVDLKIVKENCDIIGKDKNGKTFYFEVKSSSRNKNEAYGGTVMLTELYAGINNKDCYKFIVCKGKGEDYNKWDFKEFTVDEFMEFCALTTPLLRYAYHPKPKEQPKFRKITRKADEELVEEMWKDFEKWKESAEEKAKNDSIKDKDFYKHGRTKFFENREEKYIMKYSKEHKTGNIKYWYGISDDLYKKMKEKELTHVFLDTENDGIIKLPISELDKYLKTANITIDINGQKMYQVYVKPIKNELCLFSAGKSEIPLKEYIK